MAEFFGAITGFEKWGAGTLVVLIVLAILFGWLNPKWVTTSTIARVEAERDRAVAEAKAERDHARAEANTLVEALEKSVDNVAQLKQVTRSINKIMGVIQTRAREAGLFGDEDDL